MEIFFKVLKTGGKKKKKEKNSPQRVWFTKFMT